MGVVVIMRTLFLQIIFGGRRGGIAYFEKKFFKDVRVEEVCALSNFHRILARGNSWSSEFESLKMEPI